MFDIVIVAGGASNRAGIDKLSFEIGNISILNKTIDCFHNIDNINKIIVVSDKKIDRDDIIIAQAGSNRSESVKNGLAKVTSPYCLIHDGARPFVSKKLIKKIMVATTNHNSCIPYISTPDSLRRRENNLIVESIGRRDVVRVQTPQGFATDMLKEAFKLSKNEVFSDESEVFAEYMLPPFAIEGEISNKKITYFEDLANINCHIGSGFDVHKFITNKKLVLGGIVIPYDKGLEAHSDGDVVLHAVMDSILTAIGQRDIGFQFPDTDENYKDIDSTILLKKVLKMAEFTNRKLISLTITIMAQNPKLSPFIPKMQKNIAELLGANESQISISATTTENLGIIGENKGIAVLSIASYA